VYADDPKVWTQAGFALSECGDARFGRALASVEWRDDPVWFDHNALAAINSRAKQYELEADDCAALIGYRGALYQYAGGAIWRAADAYAAVGCASDFVTGYLCASRAAPRERVRLAVKHAAKHVEGVGGRVRVVVV
jgi:hypothetical protein